MIEGLISPPNGSALSCLAAETPREGAEPSCQIYQIRATPWPGQLQRVVGQQARARRQGGTATEHALHTPWAQRLAEGFLAEWSLGHQTASREQESSCTGSERRRKPARRIGVADPVRLAVQRISAQLPGAGTPREDAELPCQNLPDLAYAPARTAAARCWAAGWRRATRQHNTGTRPGQNLGSTTRRWLPRQRGTKPPGHPELWVRWARPTWYALLPNGSALSCLAAGTPRNGAEPC